MKRLSNIIVAAAVSFLLTGCGIYNKYEQKVQAPADAFGTSQDIERASGDTSIAQMSWREFFTDPQLQQLIEQVLANNTDLNSARIAVEKSQAALTAAKLAYLPALSFSPQGALSSFDHSKAVKTYDLPLQLMSSVLTSFRLLPNNTSCYKYSTASWTFSHRPTVCGTSHLRPSRHFGKTVRPTALLSTRWRHRIWT